MILLMMLMSDTVSLDLTLQWQNQSLTQVENTSRSDNDTGEHSFLSWNGIFTYSPSWITSFILQTTLLYIQYSYTVQISHSTLHHEYLFTSFILDVLFYSSHVSQTLQHIQGLRRPESTSEDCSTKYWVEQYISRLILQFIRQFYSILNIHITLYVSQTLPHIYRQTSR